MCSLEKEEEEEEERDLGICPGWHIPACILAVGIVSWKGRSTTPIKIPRGARRRILLRRSKMR